MIYTIYEINNMINGKIYIGFHSIPDESYIETMFSDSGSCYRDGYLGSGKNMKKALEKYGPETFSQKIIFVTDDKDEATEHEKILVNQEFVAREDTYNISIGGNVAILVGEANGFYGKKHTPESIDKIQSSRRRSKENGVKWSWCKMHSIEHNCDVYTYDEIKALYPHIESRHDIHSLVYAGKVRFYSNYLQEKVIAAHKERLKWLSESEQRAEHKSNLVSLRFSGIPKSLESNQKRSLSLKSYNENNRDIVKEKMLRINKNPEKIEKTATAHKGMKRSIETCSNISKSKLGKPPSNKGKIWVIDHTTKHRLLINKEDDLPEGYVRGMK